MTEHSTVQENEASQLVDGEGPIPIYPRRTVDAALGAVPPLSDDEQAARADALARTLDVVASITDETDDETRELEAMRDFDACRPHRKLFEGMY